MTLAGARGRTAEEMQKVLHVGDAQAAAREYGELVKHLQEVKERAKFELNIANALWGQRSVAFSPEFIQLLAKEYQSGLRQVDFKGNAEGARRQINEWVSEQTRQKIPQLIGQGVLGRDTRLVLTNAIYFKATWESQFKKQVSGEGEFWAEGSDRVKVRMMKQTMHANYAEDDTAQMLELPYEGGAESMVIVLPKQRDGLAAVEKGLDAAKFRALLAQGVPSQVKVALPAFTIRQQAELASLLSGMGMPDAFSDKADFSGMTKQERLAISKVIHEAYVAVDENGTEAAAATAVAMRLTAMPMGKTVEFTADHPFFFAIRDRESGAILFVGRLVRPSAAE
jgi:serpin B